MPLLIMPEDQKNKMDTTNIVKIKIAFWDGFFKSPNTNGEIVLTRDYAECKMKTIYSGGSASESCEKVLASENKNVVKAFDSFVAILERKFVKTNVEDADGFAIEFIDSSKRKIEKFFNFSFKTNRLAKQGNSLMKLFEYMISRCDVFKNMKRTVIRPKKSRKPNLNFITDNGKIKRFRIDYCGLVYRLNGAKPESYDFKKRKWHMSDAALREFYMGTESYEASALEVYKQIKEVEQQIKKNNK